MKPKLGVAWMIYGFLAIASGFVSLGFTCIMWYYVAKFVGIPMWIWGAFAIASAITQVFVNGAKKELKDFTEAIKRWEAAPDAV